MSGDHHPLDGGDAGASDAYRGVMTPPRDPADSRFVQLYVEHHLVGSGGGSALFHRTASSQSSPRARTELARLAQEIDEEQETLRGIAQRIGAHSTRGRELLAEAGEKLGRLKPSGRLLRRSPLSDVLELEALLLGVTGKRQGWATLRLLADDDPRLDAAQFDALAQRADAQLDVLTDLHREAVTHLPQPR